MLLRIIMFVCVLIEAEDLSTAHGFTNAILMVTIFGEVETFWCFFFSHGRAVRFLKRQWNPQDECNQNFARGTQTK